MQPIGTQNLAVSLCWYAKYSRRTGKHEKYYKYDYAPSHICTALDRQAFCQSLFRYFWPNNNTRPQGPRTSKVVSAKLGPQNRNLLRLVDL
jgi:hypothetical protein